MQNSLDKMAETKNGNSTSKKFLFVSHIALAGDLAWTLKNEGHRVRFWIEDRDSKDIYDGFVEKVDDWKEHADWADVIVFDDDKGFGQEEMKTVGISVLPQWMFTGFDDAIEFIKKNPDRYVMKPSGKAQDEKTLLFVGKEDDGKDLIQVLEHYKKTWAKVIKIFQLQKHVSGVEVAVGAFFNGKEFIITININFEHKSVFPGEFFCP